MKNTIRKCKKASVSKKSRRGQKPSLNLESLEIRDLLAANALDIVDNLSVTSGQPVNMTLDFDPSSDSGIFGLRIEGTSGDYDPTAPFIYKKDTDSKLSANQISPLSVMHDVDGTTDSLIVFEAGPTDLTIEVGGSGTGDFKASLFLIGDSNGDGNLTEIEKMEMVAAELQGRGAGNFNTAEYFQIVYGIDFNEDQYEPYGDANGNGKIDPAELGYITENEGKNILVDLIGDSDPPAVSIGLVTDTGLSNSDNISQPPATTTEAAITGTITDFSKITSAVLTIDGQTDNSIDLVNMPMIQFIDVGDNKIEFSLSINNLDFLLGGSIVDSTSHTLNIVTLDDIGNTNGPGVDFIFTFDDQAPAAPGTPDLDSASDTGQFDDDDITSDTTPTFTASGLRADSKVEFFSLGNSIGSAIVDSKGELSFTPATGLAEGPQEITMQETDLAGNIGPLSTGLNIRIDTLSPGNLIIELDNKTTEEQLTGDDNADISGSVSVDKFESNFFIELQDGKGSILGSTTSSSGNFSFTNIPLNEGNNDFQFVTFDLAGNKTTQEFDVTRNKKPEIDPATFAGLSIDETTSDSLNLSNNNSDDILIGTLGLTSGSEDSTETLDYSIISVTAFDKDDSKVTLNNVEFEIDDATGKLSIVADPNAELDFEGTVRKLTFEVSVTDDLGDSIGGTGLSDSETFDVTINDVNDRPTADQTGIDTNEGLMNFDVEELDDSGNNIANSDAVGPAMSTFFNDVDSGQTVTYSITGGNTNNAFTIDNKTGQIQINNINEFDFETTPSYSLTITATDTSGAANNSVTANVDITIVDINEAPVTTTDPFLFTIGEFFASDTAIPGQTGGNNFGTAFTDPDNADGQDLQNLTFSTDDARFVFDGTTLKTKAGLTAADLDFESLGSNPIVFNVTASDGKLSTKASVEITVQDENDTPTADLDAITTAEGNGDFDVEENDGTGNVTNGDNIGPTLDGNVFNDVDAGQDLTYSITKGNTNNAFTIDSKTGQIQINDINELDFETTQSYTLEVTATDDGTGMLSVSADVNITIVAVNEAPSIDQTSYTVSEVITATQGAKFGPILFSDPEVDDPNQNDTVSFTEITNGTSGESLLFNVDTDGNLVVQSASQIAPGTYKMDVEGKDSGGLSTGVVTLSIEVLDNQPPELVQTAFSVDENSPVNVLTPVFTLEATDPDDPDDVPFTFQIVGGTGQGSFDLVDLSEDTKIGVSISDNSALDFETNPTLTLQIQTTDNVGSAKTETVTITINDLNDQPTFDAPGKNPTVNEFVISGTGKTDAELGNPIANDVVVDLTTLFADEDNGGNQALDFTILETSLNGAFTIDGSNLVIDDPTVLDAESSSSVTLKVQADDQQGESNSKVTGEFTIDLIERNELPDLTGIEAQMEPVVTFSSITQDTNKGGFVIGNLFTALNLSDSDDPENDTLIIVETTNPASAFLEIDPTTGKVSTSQPIGDDDLGGQTSKSFTLDFRIADGTNDNADFGYRDFQVEVTISKNLPPVISTANSFAVDENTAVSSTVVFDVDATDPEGDNPVTYSINDPSGTFDIDTNTGEITIKANAALDHETNDSLLITVTAADSLNNESDQLITVTVNDVNEAPVFDDETYNFEFAEDSTTQAKVELVSATDPDEDPMDTLTFSVDDNRFFFDGSELKLNSPIDFEDDNAFDDVQNRTIDLVLTVSDGNGEEDQVNATVTITDVDESPIVVGGINDLIFNESDVNAGNPDFDDEDGDLNDDQFQLTFAASNFLSAFDEVDLNDNLMLSVDTNSSTINSDVINSISFDEGNNLVVVFNHLASAQDRSFSTIDVIASDLANNMAGPVSFTLGVNPEKTVDFQFRNTLNRPSDDTNFDDFTIEQLTTNQDIIPNGSTFFTEIWVTSLLDMDQVSPGRPHAITLGGVELDFSYDDSIIQVVDSVITTPLVVGGFNGDISNSGSVERLTANIALFDAQQGKVTNPQFFAADGKYIRIGYVEFSAIDAGNSDTPIGQMVNMGDFGFEITRTNVQHFSSDGNNDGLIDFTQTIDESQIQFESPKIDVVDGTVFTIDSKNTSFSVDGSAAGNSLSPQSPGSDTTSATGTITVRLDDPNNPTQIQILSSNIVLENTPGSFAPGSPASPGGSPTNASEPANFALGYTGDVQGNASDGRITVRDTILSLDSSLITLNNDSFASDELNYDVNNGVFNVRETIFGGAVEIFGASESFAGATFAEDNTSNSTSELQGSNGNFTLNINFDLLDSFFVDVAQVDLNVFGNITATAGGGAPLLGTVVAESGLPLTDGTALFTTVTKEPTELRSNSQVHRLPQNETWVNEWEGFWVEVWGSTEHEAGIAQAAFDLKYNSDYFTATDFEFSDAFTGNGEFIIDDATGLISGVSGSSDLGSLGNNQFVLIGRARFESLDGDQVSMGENGSEFSPKSLGIELDSVQVDVANFGRVISGTSSAPDTEVWAVPYDINDDNTIGLSDLTSLISRFGDSSVSATDDTLAAALDFDNSGAVDLSDLTQIVSNFGLTKGQGDQLNFPATFTQMWIGQSIETSGPDSVEEVFEEALSDWQEALGLDAPLDVTLVVKDFNTNQLGEAQITELDSEGLPLAGILSLDDDANGLGWSSDLAGGPAAGQYDLYTVIMHELGHIHGFMVQYEGFANLITQDNQGNSVIDLGGQVAVLDYFGQHLDDTIHAGDLMNDTLDPGVRKSISTLDVEILEAAYASATAGAAVDTTAAALHGVELPTADASSSTEFALSEVIDLEEVSGSTGVAVVLPDATRKELSKHGIKLATNSFNSEQVLEDVNNIYAGFELPLSQAELDLGVEDVEALASDSDETLDADDLFAEWEELELN